MADTIAPLVLDLLAWLAPGPRPYHDVMEAWRTSCPRLTVWEDALDAGLIACHAGGTCPVMVELTMTGPRTDPAELERDDCRRDRRRSESRD